MSTTRENGFGSSKISVGVFLYVHSVPVKGHVIYFSIVAAWTPFKTNKVHIPSGKRGSFTLLRKVLLLSSCCDKWLELMETGCFAEVLSTEWHSSTPAVYHRYVAQRSPALQPRHSFSALCSNTSRVHVADRHRLLVWIITAVGTTSAGQNEGVWNPAAAMRF